MNKSLGSHRVSLPETIRKPTLGLNHAAGPCLSPNRLYYAIDFLSWKSVETASIHPLVFSNPSKRRLVRAQCWHAQSGLEIFAMISFPIFSKPREIASRS